MTKWEDFQMQTQRNNTVVKIVHLIGKYESKSKKKWMES